VPYPRDDAASSRSETGAVSQDGQDGPEQAELLVPLDAWRRMLDQLGQLHEAGQQLAAAEARRAKAETKAEFLAERVGELQARLAELESRFPPALDGVVNQEAPEAGSERSERRVRKWWVRTRGRSRIPSGVF
jgi:hypothetical protein